MSDTDTIRRALGAFQEDSDKQGDRAAIKNALDDTFYAAMDSIYKLPYPSYTPKPATKIPPKPVTPVKPQTPIVPPRQASPLVQQPAATIPNLLKGIQDNIAGGQEWARGEFNFDPNVENIIGAGAGIGNMLAGAIGGGIGKVAEGANWLDEAMVRARNVEAPGELPADYKPFTEQVADIAGQYNERIQEPIAGVLGNLTYGMGEANPLMIGNRMGAPAVDTRPPADQTPAFAQLQTSLAALQSGNIGGAVDNALRAFQTYGNAEYDRLNPTDQFVASLVFDPINFIPGLGIGKLQKATKLDELGKVVGKIDDAADLLPASRIKTPVAKITETIRSALNELFLRTDRLDNVDEYFDTYKAFVKAGVEGQFDDIAKKYAGVATIGGQRATRLIQGFSKELETVEAGHRAAQTALRGAAVDTKTLPKAYARFLDDVKANPANFPNVERDLLDLTKAELTERTQKYMAKTAKGLYPQKGLNAPTNLAKRFLNNLKAAEALAYIGLSPFTFIRNVVNGITTMAIEGVNPLWDAAQEVARLKSMGQVEKAAALQRAIKFQKTMIQTGDVVRQALGEGGYSTAMTGAMGSFMSKMMKQTGLGKPLEWYQAMENAMRARVWTQTYWKGVTSTWVAGKGFEKVDAGLAAILRQYGLDEKTIENIVEEIGPNEGALVRGLNDFVAGKRGPALDIDALAAEMGVTRADLVRVLDEHDVAKAREMFKEHWMRVVNGEEQAAVVEDVVGRAADEAAQATGAKTGQLTEIGAEGLPVKAAGVDDAQLQGRLNELVQRQDELDRELNTLRGSKNKVKIERRKEIMAEMDAISNERTELQEALGMTDEEILFGSNPAFPEPPKGAKVVTPEVKRPPMTVEQYVDDYMAGKGRGTTPEDLEYQQFAANNAQEIEQEFQKRAATTSTPPVTSVAEDLGNKGKTSETSISSKTSLPPLESDLPPVDFPAQVLSQGQQNARDYLLGIKRADGTPLYTAKQLETWKPETLENVAGELQMHRTTFDDIMRTARDRKVPTATEKGAPNNRNLLNVLNKHKDAGAPRFETIDDVRARADEAVKILDNYVPSAKPAPKAAPVEAPPVPPPSAGAATGQAGNRLTNFGVPDEVAAGLAPADLNALEKKLSGLLKGWTNDGFNPVEANTWRDWNSSIRYEWLKDKYPDLAEQFGKKPVVAPKREPVVAPPKSGKDAVRDSFMEGKGVGKGKANAVLNKKINYQFRGNDPLNGIKTRREFIEQGFELGYKPAQHSVENRAGREVLEWVMETPTKSSYIITETEARYLQHLIDNEQAFKVGNVPPLSEGGATLDAGEPVLDDLAKINAQARIAFLRRMGMEDEAATAILSADEMTKAKARTQADMLEALMNLLSREDVKRYRLGTDVQARLNAWLRRGVLPGAAETRQAATVAADWTDNAVMISRDGETTFDAALGVLSPFQFWRSRFALQSLRRVADKPARLAWYLKLREGQDQIQDDPRYPKRLRGMMQIPFPFAPAWAGPMFADVLEYGTSLEQVFGANQFEDEVTDADVAKAIRALAADGKISLVEAQNAIANMRGVLWDQTKDRMVELNSTSAGADDLASLFRPHLPLDIIWKLKTGRADEIGVLFPMTRIVRNLTGANIEQPLKAGLRSITGAEDIPDWDMWEESRTDKALADMVGDGLLTERDALIALIERKGPAFEQARMRAAEQMRLQNFSVFGGQLFPTGEQEYYKSLITRNRYMDEAVASVGANPAELSYGEKWDVIRANNLNKKGTPLQKFYDEYPVYSTRGSVYDEPEARLKEMLMDEIWAGYNSKGKLDKRLMADDLGEAFKTLMLDKDTRDLTNVTLDQLGEWTRRIRGYVPQQDILQVGDFPEVRYGTLDQNERYNNIAAQRDRLFNMDVIAPKLDTYHNLSKDDARAYRDIQTDLDAYLDWYGKSMRDNPDIAKLLNPEYQAFTGSYVNTRDAANDVTRYTVANLENMIRRIGGRQGRGGGGFNPNPLPPNAKPPVLSNKAKQAILAKRKDPQYFIPREVFEELLAYFRTLGIRGGFQQWLDGLVMGGVM